MRKLAFGKLAFVFSVAFALAAGAAVEGFYGFTMKRLDGRPESLATYRGQVLLVVNVASRCGYTPQYEGLQSLYEKYQARGFRVLGFPSNDFGRQEPGTNEEIADFCKLNYGVAFPMFAKIRVSGDDADPLYQWLTSRPAPVGGPVRWNFQKYLVNRQGDVVARYDSKVTPQDPELVSAIEKLLGE